MVGCLLVLSAVGVGLYAYALDQWQTAQAAVKSGQLDEAQRRLNLCLFVWPRSISVHLLAARTARLRGDFEGAEAHLNRCLKLNRGASQAIQLEFLLMRVQGGEVDEVAGDLLSLYVENNNPESPLILETLARVYLQNLRYGPAFACLSRWIEAAPDAAEPFRWRGWILENMSDRQGAMKEYKRALELDANHFPARLQLIDLYLHRSDPLTALPHLEYLRKQYPDRPDVLARLGQCRFLQGETEEARRLLEAAERQLPNDSDVLIHLAKLEMQASPPRSAEAETWLRRALAVDPTDREVRHLLVSCLQSQGRLEEAQAMMKQHAHDEALMKRINNTLKQEADKAVGDPAALTDVGVLFLRSNERIGRYWLHRALQREPDYQPALKALVAHYESKGELEKAAVYRQKLKAEPRP